MLLLILVAVVMVTFYRIPIPQAALPFPQTCPSSSVGGEAPHQHCWKSSSLGRLWRSTTARPLQYARSKRNFGSSPDVPCAQNVSRWSFEEYCAKNAPEGCSALPQQHSISLSSPQGPKQGGTNPAPPARPPGLFFQQCWWGSSPPTLLEVRHLTWSRRANAEASIPIDKVNNFLQVNRPRQPQLVALVVSRRHLSTRRDRDVHSQTAT